MDIILLVVFSYLLHKQADKKGVSPWPYVLNFISIFILTSFVVSYLLSNFIGVDVLKSDKALLILLGIELLVIGFEVLLFFYMKKRIKSVQMYDDNDDVPPPTKGNKKDLSYFR